MNTLLLKTNLFAANYIINKSTTSIPQFKLSENCVTTTPVQISSSTIVNSNEYVTTEPVSIIKHEYTLILDDDFTNNGNINSTIWEKIPIINGYTGYHWRNNKSTIDDMFIESEDGLKLCVYNNYNLDPDLPRSKNCYLTCGIWTNSTYTFKYGKVEVIALMHNCVGCWPSIWVSGIKNNVVINGIKNDSSEVDLSECYEFDQSTRTTIHSNYLNYSTTKDLNVKEQPRQSYIILKLDVFNKYVCEVLPEVIRVYINDIKIIEYQNYHKTDINGVTLYPFTLDNNPLRLILDSQIFENSYLINKYWTTSITPEQTYSTYMALNDTSNDIIVEENNNINDNIYGTTENDEEDLSNIYKGPIAWMTIKSVKMWTYD